MEISFLLSGLAVCKVNADACGDEDWQRLTFGSFGGPSTIVSYQSNRSPNSVAIPQDWVLGYAGSQKMNL